MTIIKIEKTDKDMFAQILADCGVKGTFYTIETNDLMLQCEIETVSDVTIFSIGKIYGMIKTDASWQESSGRTWKVFSVDKDDLPL